MCIHLSVHFANYLFLHLAVYAVLWQKTAKRVLFLNKEPTILNFTIYRAVMNHKQKFFEMKYNYSFIFVHNEAYASLVTNTLRKRAFRVRHLLEPLSMIHVLV